MDGSREGNNDAITIDAARLGFELRPCGVDAAADTCEAVEHEPEILVRDVVEVEAEKMDPQNVGDCARRTWCVFRRREQWAVFVDPEVVLRQLVGECVPRHVEHSGDHIGLRAEERGAEM